MSKLLLILPLLVVVSIAYGDHPHAYQENEVPKCKLVTNGIHNASCVELYRNQVVNCADDLHSLYHSRNDAQRLHAETSQELHICKDSLKHNPDRQMLFFYMLDVELLKGNVSDMVYKLYQSNVTTSQLQERLDQQIKELHKENQQLRLRCQR